MFPLLYGCTKLYAIKAAFAASGLYLAYHIPLPHVTSFLISFPAQAGGFKKSVDFSRESGYDKRGRKGSASLIEGAEFLGGQKL
jgi:hypothetical protein